MALTMEWTASSSDEYGSGESTATLKRYSSNLGVLKIEGEYGTYEQVRLTEQELRELATMATALADGIRA
jgi:ribosomal protein S24E